MKVLVTIILTAICTWLLIGFVPFDVLDWTTNEGVILPQEENEGEIKPTAPESVPEMELTLIPSLVSQPEPIIPVPDEREPTLPPWDEREPILSPQEGRETTPPLAEKTPKGTYISSSPMVGIGGVAITFENDRLTLVSFWDKSVCKYEIIKNGKVLLLTNVLTGEKDEVAFEYITEVDCVILGEIEFWGETPN